MTLQFFQKMGLLIIVVMISSSCLVSDLHNGFDLKSPGGFVLYLTGPDSGGSTLECVFDAASFDSCNLGP